jgi:hypothetical protein
MSSKHACSVAVAALLFPIARISFEELPRLKKKSPFTVICPNM